MTSKGPTTKRATAPANAPAVAEIFTISSGGASSPSSFADADLFWFLPIQIQSLIQQYSALAGLHAYEKLYYSKFQYKYINNQSLEKRNTYLVVKPSITFWDPGQRTIYLFIIPHQSHHQLATMQAFQHLSFPAPCLHASPLTALGLNQASIFEAPPLPHEYQLKEA